MNIAVGIVALLGLIALSVVGAATFVEVRPVVKEWREQRQRYPWAYQETVRIIPIRQFTERRHPADYTGHLMALILCLVLLVAAYWEWSNFRFDGEWPTIEGVVLDSRLETTDGETSATNVVLQFRYVVDGREFTGQWVENERGALMSNFMNTREFLARYRPGQPVTIWYHPLLPDYPSLGRITLWYVMAAIGIGSALLIGTGFSLLASMRLIPLVTRAQR